MQSVEELRDILAQLQEELQTRREQANKSELLLSGIESLLSTEAGSDPFAIAFQSLGRVLQHDDALALIAERRADSRGAEGQELLCVSATQTQPDRAQGAAGQNFEKSTGRACGLWVGECD